jgi:hypothetical protein
MIRAIKIAVTANLLLSAAVILGYTLYASLKGLPIGECFLGGGRWGLGRSGGREMPAWAFPVLLEAVILAAYLGSKASGRQVDRTIAGILGLVWLLGLLLDQLPRRAAPDGEESTETPRIAPAPVVPRLDRGLNPYMWGSLLLYGLVGRPGARPAAPRFAHHGARMPAETAEEGQGQDGSQPPEPML